MMNKENRFAMPDDNRDPEKLSLELVIVNELGLHARSAAMIAGLARQAAGGVWLEKNHDRVDAREIMDLLTLAAARGDRVRVSIDHMRDREILDRIARLIREGFGE